jgi:predicted DNA-binding protein
MIQTKRKRGRPKKQENIFGQINTSFRIDKDTYEIIKDMSANSDRTMSAMIRQLLKKGIKESESV